MRNRALVLLLGWSLLAGSAEAGAASAAVDPLLEAARAAEARHDAGVALQLALQAETGRPDDPALLQLISRLYSEHAEEIADPAGKKRLCSASLDYARRAHGLQPDSAVNVLSLAIAYGKLALLSGPGTRIEHARKVHAYAAQSLDLDPDYALAHHVLGRWHCQIASLNPATRWIARLAGGLPPASFREGHAHLRRAVQLAPDVAAHHVELGFALLADHQSAAARSCFERALALTPRDAHDVREQERARQALQRDPALQRG